MGLYISSSGCSYSADYAQDLYQWLLTGEDRSQQEQVKTEWIIRLGEQLSLAIQEASGADSVIFLNGDLGRGKAFMQAYDATTGQLRPGASLPQGLDRILVIQRLTLKKRMTNMAYVRSNQMVNERVPVMVAHLAMQQWLPGQAAPLQTATTFDAYTSPRPSQLVIALSDPQPGNLSLFLSQAFTNWWALAAKQQ